MYTAVSLPSSPHSYSCWEHRPRSHPYPSAQYHGEPHLPVPILCPLFPLSGTTPLFTAALGSQFTLAPRIRIPVVSCILHPQFLLLFFSPHLSLPICFSSHLPPRKTSGKPSLPQLLEDCLWFRSVFRCALLLLLGEEMSSTPLSHPSPLFPAPPFSLSIKAAADSFPSRE